MRHAAQMDLALPPQPRVEPDFPAEARQEIGEALALAEAAVDRPPWNYRRQRYWRVVFPQMAGWLPADEREALVEKFMVELERIELLFGEGEKE